MTLRREGLWNAARLWPRPRSVACRADGGTDGRKKAAGSPPLQLGAVPSARVCSVAIATSRFLLQCQTAAIARTRPHALA